MFGFGKMLKDYLEFNKISQTDFANKLGITKKHMNEILNENTEISSEIILAISLLTDIDTSLILFAENKRKMYNYLHNKFNNEKEIKKFLNTYHIDELNKRKWVIFKDIDCSTQTALDILEFMNIKNFDLIDEYNDNKILYKKKDNDDMLKVSMWIIHCDEISKKQIVAEYNKNNLNLLINELKIEQNKKFDIKKLTQIFNKYGIYFVVEEPLKESKIKGCMMVKENSPVIYMTKQFRKKASFYFTLYHELGHIKTDYNKAKSKIIIDSENYDEKLEKKADIFSLNTMIPETIWLEIKNNIDQVEKICKKNNIPVSFATSRLAKEGYISYKSNLYQRYC